jgi:UDP-GlcNAc3NAcA epimerase
MSVVGARPQFIKLAPLHDALKKSVSHIIVHTGQHWDDAMSARFFAELKLPEPDVHLGVHGGGHAVPTARMLLRLSGAIDELKPDWLVIYGDTTTTLAGALAGAQCGVRVAHVEAGLRSFLKSQPEERNRVVADHLADCLFCPTAGAVNNLRQENITRGVHKVGDPMHEALAAHWPRASRRPLLTNSDPFLFCTLHRAENTDDPVRLGRFVQLVAGLPHTVVLPLHPRTHQALRRHGLWRKFKRIKNVEIHEPFGYLDTLRHMQAASAVLTDSGGVQREAAWLGTFCLTLRSVTEWVETVEKGQNVLVDLDLKRALAALDQPRPRRAPARKARGASRRIAEILLRS